MQINFSLRISVHIPDPKAFCKFVGDIRIMMFNCFDTLCDVKLGI